MQLYNYDNWYLEGIGILMTLVTMFTTSYFLSSLLKSKRESRYTVWKYFGIMFFTYAISRCNFTLYTYRTELVFSAVFISCFLFSSDKLFKKIFVPLGWILMNVFSNIIANSLGVVKLGLTPTEYMEMPYEELYALKAKEIYSSFCIQGFNYTFFVFSEMIILLFINRKKVKTKEIFFINLFTFILVSAINLPLYFMAENKSMVIIGGVSFFASVFLMIYSYSRLKFYQEYSQTEAENKFLKEKETMRLDYYNEMKVKEEQIRKINHDIKNNISVIYGLKNDKDRDKFIKKIDEDLKKHELVKYSNNDILNIILNTKVSKADKLGIKVDVDIKNNVNFMEDIDVSNLFTNILDNAIENSSLVDEKFIKFSIRKKLGNVVIECINSYDGKVNYKDKKYKSRKNEEHGYGLRIIEDIVKKYNGEMKVEHDEKIFDITMIFLDKE